VAVPDRAWLVADLGGTNVRPGLAQPGSKGRPLLRQVPVVCAADFGSFDQAANSYLADAGEPVKAPCSEWPGV